MNGRGARWLGRLSPAPRWHPTGAIHCRALPCYAARSFSHGSCRLSRVTTRRRVSSPAKAALGSEAPGKGATHAPIDDTEWYRGPTLPQKEVWDAEGRTYFISGADWGYHHYHGRSVQGGHVRAAYTARDTFFDPSTRILEYRRPIKRPLLILYQSNFVEDDEFWDELSVLCDFATSITERAASIEGHSPERDSTPVEFIYVQARFHCNCARPDEPWHITVDYGNRKTWNDGDGFLRRECHIYAKNNDLSQGYAGYSSSVFMRGALKHMSPSLKNRLINTRPMPGTDSRAHDPEDITWAPLGQRQYYRSTRARSIIYEATQRSFEPPALHRYRRTKNWRFLPNPTTGTIERVAYPSIRDQLDTLVNSIREGASKRGSEGGRSRFQVVDYSGNRVHIRQAVFDAKSKGKHIPPAWELVLRRSYAEERSQVKVERNPSVPVSFSISQSARRKTGRTRRIAKARTRCQQQPSRTKGSYGSEASSSQQSKVHGLLEQGLGTRKEEPGAGQPQLRGDSRSRDNEPSFKKLNRGSAVPQRLDKSKDTARASRTKLTIRDSLDKDTAVSQGFSTSQKLVSTASHKETLVTSSNGSKPETRGRSRKPLVRRLRGKAKMSDRGKALLEAMESVEVSNQPGGPDPKAPALGEAPARPPTKQSQMSSLGNILLNFGGPVPGGSGPPFASPGSWNGTARKPGAQPRGSGHRKASKNVDSPLPPSAADLSSERPKKSGASYQAQGPKRVRDSKPSAAWVSPKPSKEATSGQTPP